MKRVTRSKPEIIKVGNITVRLYRRERETAIGKKRTVFEVADHTIGKRRFRGFSDYAEARREAEKIARQLASGDVVAAKMGNNEAASYGRAIQLLRSTGISLEVVAANYAKAIEILGGDSVIEASTFYARHRADKLEHRKIADVILELLANRASDEMSARYVEDLRNRLARFAKNCGADTSTIYQPTTEAQPDTRNRGVDISTITTADVQRWLDGLKLSTQSKKNFRTVLQTLFNFAETRGYIIKGSNPASNTASIKVRGGSTEIFTPDEITNLLKAASEDFLPFLALGAFAGMRSAEIQRLKWSDIDRAGDSIQVSADDAKTASRRLIPITQNLKEWLQPYTDRTGLIWNHSGNDLRDARQATVKLAKIPWKSNGLRHSFISYRLAIVQSAAQVALEAGNSPDIVFKHYRELVKPDAAKKWFEIGPASAQ